MSLSYQQTRRKLMSDLIQGALGAVLAGLGAIAFLFWIPATSAGSALLLLVCAGGFGLLAVGMAYYAWQRLSILITLPKTLETEATRSTPAQVSWTPSGYAPERKPAPDPALDTPTRAVSPAKPAEPEVPLVVVRETALQPRDYVVHYQTETGLVLAADPTGPIDPARLRAALNTVFAITPDDLDALRQGQISPVHRQRLVFAARADERRSWGLPLVMLCLGLALSAYIVIGLYGARLETPGAWLLGLAPTIFLLSMSALYVVKSRRGVQAAGQSGVELADGPVTASILRGRYQSRALNFYHLGPRQFKASEAAYLAPISPGRYRLYILRTSQELIACEPLPIGSAPDAVG